MATQTEVARHLSLTDRQLRRLQKLPGAPVSNKRGQLDLDAWRDFYISYLRRSKNDVPDGDSEEDYEEKLLIARWELTSEQAVTQQLKNEVSKGKLIDTGFCIFALSKLAMALSSTLDSIPLSAYSALFDHGLASKSDQRFASIRSTGNLTFSTAF